MQGPHDYVSVELGFVLNAGHRKDEDQQERHATKKETGILPRNAQKKQENGLLRKLREQRAAS